MFTVQQIQEIAKKLSFLGKKDSELLSLDTWGNIKENDLVAIVHNNSNVVITIKQLFEYLKYNIDASIVDYENRLDSLETLVSSIKQELNTSISNLQTQIVNINKDININKTSISSINSEISSIKTILNESKNKIDTLESKVTTIEPQLNNTIRELNTVIDSTTQLTSKVTILETKVNKCLEDIAGLKKRCLITVNPTPTEATVFINEQQVSSLEVEQGSSVTIRVTAEGYEQYEETITAEGNSVVLNPVLNRKVVTLTISPTPSDAIVKLDGSIQTSKAVNRGTVVNWEVSKEGYKTKTGQVKVTTTHTLEVALEAIETVTFSINSFPENATVTINGQQVNQVLVEKGTTVSWSVSAPGYVTQNGSEVVNNNVTKTITLLMEQVTITINPIPKEAEVQLDRVVQNSITVTKNSTIHVKVSHPGYSTVEFDHQATETKTMDISLTQIHETAYVSMNIEKGDNTPALDKIPSSGGNINLKAMVTVRMSDTSTIQKDLTAQSTWSNTGTFLTSTGKGQYSCSPNLLAQSRDCTVTATISGPSASRVYKTITITQL